MFGRGRTKGSKNKKGTRKSKRSACAGHIQMACNRMPSCKYVYGKKRQFCRKSKNRRTKGLRNLSSLSASY
jgi:hypothetical protein